jgi:hypothetical protein
MNWQMLLYFLRKVVTIGEQETAELMKVYETVKLLAEQQAKEEAA